MSDYLVISLDEFGTGITAAGRVSKAGDWLEAVPLERIGSVEADEVIAVLTGTGVTVWRESLPKLPAAKLARIVPGMMEDRLATPSADHHFAIWPAGDASFVAVTKQSLMDSVFATLRAHGLEPTRIVPDFMLVDMGEATAAAIGLDGFVRVRQPDGTGFTAERALAEAMLPEGSAEGVDLNWNSLLARAATTDFNLCQGRYAARADVMAFVLWFRRAGLILLAAFAVWIAATLMETSKLADSTEAVYAETEALFRSSFPDVKRIANMRAQARQEVMKLRQQSGGEFLKLSGILFKETSLSDGTLIDGLRFDNARGELAVTLSFASFAEGEAFKKKLTAAGVDVSEGGSRQEGARVVTDLVLRSAS